ncbi:MAG: site-specific DNA-methyltransferase [Prevotella sp.]|nr:site-specific DNA-methyltransferase [Prevotella sp.]
MTSEVYNIDCLEYMRTLPDNAFQLAIADPPYGIREAGGQTGGSGKLKGRIFNNGYIDRWDKAPDQSFFEELFRISENQIIWGGNYFDLPPTRGIICWDKEQPWENFSQIEYAWTSFDTPAQLFRYDNRTGDKIHPTQKPVALYAWLLKKYAKPGDSIFDPMMGSQSSRIAAYKMGFDYAGCEIDKEYFDKGCERFNRDCLHEYKTKSGKTIKQLNLF